TFKITGLGTPTDGTDAATKAYADGIGVPSGAVMAFDLSDCPSGWSEYTPARGRFIRGIDNGAGNDPDGTRTAGATQDDAFQDHIHTLEIYSGTPISGGNWQLATGAITTSNSAN